MNDILNSLFLVYAGLFPIVNPIGGAPIFLGLTRASSNAERDVLARLIAVNGFLLLLGSVFIGSYVLEFFGITLPILRIAGGLVVTAFAWRLLHSNDEVDAPGAAASVKRSLGLRDAFYPLTMPLTVGPGSIAVAITLGSQRPRGATTYAHLALVGIGAVLGIAAIAASIYACYRFGERLVTFLGENGTNVFLRLSAFILLCIGIEIVWTGYSALTAGAP